MKYELEFHKTPELPDHSCKCLCIMTYSDVFGIEFFEYSAVHKLFNARDTYPDHGFTDGVLAWAEVVPCSDLLEWAGVES